MLSRRWAVIVTIAVGLAACAGADDSDVVLSVESAPTTTIDFADGALIKNEGVTLDADGVPVTTDEAVVEDATADTGTPTTLAADASTGTTTVGGSTGTETAEAGDSSAGNESTDGSAGETAPDGATTGGTANNAGGTGAAAIEPGEGLIVINAVSYPFDVEFCDFGSDDIEITGAGTASDGARFEANIFYEGADVDDDGIGDSILEVSVSPEVPPGAAGDSVPQFSVFDITTSSSGSDSALEYEISGSRISGSGTIEDINGVAFPKDRPGPMTFDASCAETRQES